MHLAANLGRFLMLTFEVTGMPDAIEFPSEDQSNAVRRELTSSEPLALRTFTPTQAVFAKSAGVFHFTPEGRRLYDYSSGVLVANLGHNPRRWMQRFAKSMGWEPGDLFALETGKTLPSEFFEGVALTAYNAMTPIEAQRLAASAAQPAIVTRRRALRTDHVGGVRVRSHPESAVGLSASG